MIKEYALSLSAFGSGISQETFDALQTDFRMRNVEITGGDIVSGVNNRETTLERLKKLLEKGSIVPASIHLPVWDISAADESLRAQECSSLVEFIHFLNQQGIRAPLMTLHSSHEPPLSEHPVRLKQTRKSLMELIPLAEKYHFSLNVEYLPRTCIGNSVDELKQLVRDMEPEHIGICFDVNHAMARYREIPEMIREMAPRIRAFHISDCDESDERHWLPGKGVIDWPRVMEAINAIDHDVLLILETKDRRHNTPVMVIRDNEAAVQFLKNGGKKE